MRRCQRKITNNPIGSQTPRLGGPFSLNPDLQKGIAIGQRAMHPAFITMLIREDDATGLVYSHKACRMSVGFLPVFDRRTLLGRRLAKKAVIKTRLGMHLAVMDVHRREERARWCSGGEKKRPWDERSWRRV